ncbi:GGDEF and EAL domain-containing protein [Acetobacterium sp.]|uniref:GGDEF and EAL domain-containing protein n=1 Tax=Acetobacterium sp. TaxID=1872094 RepID=UPI00272552F1|nr:GGDEF and EAL domain-containing protein [Acetobacterium sp.]MDO9491843.1 EAL domain-containing protein [Acetobacterium sp.]
MKGVLVRILPLIFSFLFFAISGLYMFFGAYIVSVNSKEKSNRVFFVLCIFLSVWTFSLAMSSSVADMETCFFWRRVSALGWCTFAGILLHFFLILTNKRRLLKKWWIYFLIYTPAAVFIYIFALSHDMAILQYNLINTPFGWINRAENNVWNILYYIYYYSYIAIGLGVLWHWGQYSGDKRNKQQARLILYGFSISLISGFMLQILGNELFLTGATQKISNVMFIAILAMFYSIKKYKLVRMPPINMDEIILNKGNRTKIYNYLSGCFIAGSFLNIIARYFLEEQDDLIAILTFSGLLLAIGFMIQMAHRAEPLKKYQNYIIMVLIGLSIPVITFEFISIASPTIWAFPFILIIVGLVYNNRIALVGITVSIFLTQILVFIIKPQAIVEIDSSDYVARIGLFGIGVWVAFFVNTLYVQRLKQNADQIKIQKMISEFSTDFLNVSTVNFDEKTAKWLGKSGALFNIDRACICFFNEDKSNISCQQEWCNQGIESQKEGRQDIPIEAAPPWIKSIIANKVVHIFNRGDNLEERPNDVIIAIPISSKGEVRGFLAFEIKTEKDDLNLEYEGLLEIIANILADALVKIEAENEINYLAYYDQLTGLSNRLLFNERLNKGIELSKNNGKIIGVIYLDIDSFRTVNDMMGHEGSDKLLVQVSQKLVRSIKKTDVVCRFEGDGFVVMLNNMSREKEVVKVANRITGLFKHAFIVNGQEFYISANAGISIYPKDGDNGEELIKNADIAMCKAKEKGKNNYVLCSTTIKEEVILKNKLISNLYHALEKNQLRVYYQPQICLATGRIIAIEALLRWQHPELGIIPPKVIIPLAEQTGLINPIGEWVLKTACSQNKLWQGMGLPHVRIAVNISATQFRNPLLISQMKKLIKETGIKPRYLELELTENIAINKSSYIVGVLNGLKKLGMFISIDDFGTEYSSLSRLKLLPMDQLKIDKQFIDGIAENEKDQAIVDTIILLARNLGISVIAEGAETQDQIDFLKAHQCDAVQGFFYYKPMPAAEMELALRQEINISGALDSGAGGND